MRILRTPDDRFADLPDYPFAPHYIDIDALRWHYVDEGPPEGPIVLMLHGEPSWSFLYRKMIPRFTAAGMRAVAPDLPGFGRSDKPANPDDYTYQRLVDWLWAWFQAAGLADVTLICQDWGSLLGLRLVAEHPDAFARVVLANGGLPTGDQEMPQAFHEWRAFSQNISRLPIGRILQRSTTTTLSKAVLAGYEAPFPDESYKAGARILPSLVPLTPDDPAAGPNRRAWRALMRFRKPFLTAFSDGDPITRGGEAAFRRLVPGAKTQAHVTIEGAGHFLQEDQGVAFAEAVLGWIGSESQP